MNRSNDLTWHKSSRSGNHNCVEISPLQDGGRAVRDTKSRAAWYFTTNAQQWKAFIDGITAGRFDR